MKKFKSRVKFKEILWFYLVLVLIEVWYSISQIGTLISPKIINIIKNNITYYDNVLVEEYLDTKELRSSLIMELITLDKNSKEEIININIDTAKSYTVLNNISKSLKNNKSNYKDMYAKNQKDNIVLRYPIGLASNNILINGLGYRIPIKLELNSNVLTGIKTKVTNYGLNNALIEVYLKVKFTSNVVYFSLDEAVTSEYEVLLASKMVMGRVPEMFNGYLEKGIDSN